MDFTLFLNSRGRVSQLKKCISAVENMTLKHSEIEFVITADDDDVETVMFLKTLKDRGTFEFKTIVGPRIKNLHKSINNMALQAKGRYLFVLNDDSEVITKDWDKIFLEKIREYKQQRGIKDDIIYAATRDNSVDKVVGKGYASFPIVSSEAVKALGFFMYDEFVGLGGDSSIFRVYEGAGRVVDMSKIELDHVYHSNIFNIMSPDLTAYEMRVNSSEHPVDPFNIDVSNEVRKLREAIEAKQ